MITVMTLSQSCNETRSIPLQVLNELQARNEIQIALPKKNHAWHIELGKNPHQNSDLTDLECVLTVTNRKGDYIYTTTEEMAQQQLTVGHSTKIFQGTIGQFWEKRRHIFINNVEDDEIEITLLLELKAPPTENITPLTLTASPKRAPM